MNNDLTQEITNYRAEKLLSMGNPSITEAVRNAVNTVMPGALNALQGIDAETDGITRVLWEQAVTAAEMDCSLTFPQYRRAGDVIPPTAEPVSFAMARNVIAGRVARAIVIVNGMASGFAEDTVELDPVQD